MYIDSCFTFIKTITANDPLPDNPNDGDVCFNISTDEVLLFHSGEWIPVYNENSTVEINAYEPKIIPTNCRNCGAVLRSCTCEYCGTNYD